MLEGKGKKLNLNKVQGCKTKKNNPSAQEVSALQTTEGVVSLIEISAGIDAALYILDGEDSGQGNYWISEKSALDTGVQLGHTEIIDSESNPYEINLYMPDEVNNEELALQARQVFEGAVSSQAVAVQQTESLDWTGAQVVVDKSSVEIADSGEELYDAVVAIPTLQPISQGLWDTGITEFNEDTAVYVQVKVKSVPSTTTTKVQVVTPSPSVPQAAPAVKQGSTLNTAFVQCPYQYYGKTAAVRKLLCQNYWNEWVKKTWANGSLHENMLQMYDNSYKNDDYGVVFANDTRRNLKLLLAGFPDLHLSSVNGLLDAYSSIAASNPGPQVTIDQINSVDSCIVTAFDDLISKLNTGNFIEAVDYWRGNCQPFDAFVSSYETAIQQGIVKGTLIEKLQQFATSLKNYIGNDRNTLIKHLGLFDTSSGDQSDVARLVTTVGLLAEIVNIEGIIISKMLKAGIANLPPNPQPPVINAGSMALLMEAMRAAVELCPRCDSITVLTHLRDRLWQVARLGIANPLQIQEYANALSGLRAELDTAVRAVLNGWDLIDFARPVSNPATEIDVIVRKDIMGIGKVAAFIEVKNGQLVLGDASISNKIVKYVEYALGIATKCALLPIACPLRADLYFVTLIFNGQTDPGSANLMVNTANNSGIPVIIIYCVANCGTPFAIYAVANNPNITSEQALAICILLGFCSLAQISTDEPGNAIVINPVGPSDSNCKSAVCLYKTMLQ